MSNKYPSQGTPVDWIADRILRIVIGGAMLLPYKTRVAFMGLALQKVIAPLIGYRKRAEDNLALVYPDLPPQERRRIANASCDNFGRTFIENYSWKDFAAVMAKCPPSGDGMAALEEAAKAGRSVLFVSGHYGNHEATRQALNAIGYQVALLYRPLANPYVNKHYADTMAHWGGTAYAQGRPGTKQFIQHLEDGGMATLLFDVSAPGASLPFLGHPARTSLSTGALALQADALVLPFFATRQADGIHFDVDIQAPIAHSTAEQMVRDMTERLEAQIAKHPEQWFWVHRRWK